jgi:hypothetical protein
MTSNDKSHTGAKPVWLLVCAGMPSSGRGVPRVTVETRAAGYSAKVTGKIKGSLIRPN